MELHLHAFLTSARDGEDVGEGSGTLFPKKWSRKLESKHSLGTS